MQSDLDRLMTERNLDAIVVEGPDGLGSANPAFNYFVRGAHLTGLVIKKRNEPAMLIHSDWEVLQAQETGLVCVSSSRWNLRDIAARIPDRLAARVELRRQMYTDLGISGRIGLYGTVQTGPFLALLRGLEASMPGVTFVAEFDKDLISAARLTKDAHEVAVMREVGRKTCEVVQAAVDYITSGYADGAYVIDPTTKRQMTIGDVRAVIDRELAARGMVGEGTIFAQGRDAGLPHARGEDSMALQRGQAIVFDIFPKDASGYYHDMTRTFAIDYATPELQAAYDHVMGAFNEVVQEFELGAPTKPYQTMVCDYFEQRGHETIGKKYPIEEGYVHSLGHGLGLEVHEDFGFPSLADRGDVLVPGAVFSVEPGLYYPSKGYGVRIEDTYWCRSDGMFESLTDFPKDLVLTLKGTRN
ncbi:MAG: aminopeptidase P family protein [Chloroflexi bacterium]|nr:aminopeptidase P family protein [Chloroflexota bacterium]